MKKLFTTLFLIALCFGAKAQILNSNLSGLESATYKIPQGYVSEMRSQKILQYNKKNNLHIMLDREFMGKSYFYLLKQDGQTLQRAAIPSEFSVNDFAILGDTIYFCGYKNVNNAKVGYIAYVSVDDMFYTGQNYHYSTPQSVYNVSKMFAYYNGEGKRVVAAIGKQKYGEVSIQPKGGDATPITGPGPITKSQILGENNNYFWMVASPVDRDCLISYEITQTTSSGNLYNSYDIYYSDANEKFSAFTITDDYICIISNYYFSTAVPYNHIIRRIDRNNIANQLTNACLPIVNDGFEQAENVGHNCIAWAYKGYYGSGINCDVIYKIDLNTNPFTPLLSQQIYDTVNSKSRVWDLEYLPDTDRLLLLKQKGISSNNPMEDCIYYINMSNSTTFPYNTLYMRIPASSSSQHVYLSNLLRYSDDNFVVSGMEDNLLIHDKSIHKFMNTIMCNDKSYYQIIPITSPTISNIGNNLNQCKFATTTAIYYLPSNTQVFNLTGYYSQVPIHEECANMEHELEF